MRDRRGAKSAPRPKLQRMLEDEDDGQQGCDKPEECLAGGGFRVAGEEEEEEEEDNERHQAEALFHSHDHPFEPPPFTVDMVQGMTRARRLRIWRAVPPLPHNCAGTCTSCCSLENLAWKEKNMQHELPERLPRQARACKSLEVLPTILEKTLQRSSSELVMSCCTLEWNEPT